MSGHASCAGELLGLLECRNERGASSGVPSREARSFCT